ncbi:MAG: transcriptional regulator, TetR family [Ramlibacter sp.]|nr:transcriptional regulator, TetR family [Ramlibacter sp.]
MTGRKAPETAKKAPRRTAERILEVSLDLFNRFGEPNVSTTLISAELRISPGNLYYHYHAKDELINSLFDRYEKALDELLTASGGVRDVEDAWFFMHTLFELIWQYRFLYRDLNDLLSKNRRLETHFQRVLKNKAQAIRALLDGMGRAGALAIDAREVEATATSMVVVLTYWLSFEYVRDPRRALEPETAQLALLRGAHHVLNLLAPYLERQQRMHLLQLVAAYRQAEN